MNRHPRCADHCTLGSTNNRATLRKKKYIPPKKNCWCWLQTHKNDNNHVLSDTFLPFLTSNSPAIFPSVWHIYLSEWLVFVINVRKCTSPMDSYGFNGLTHCASRSLKTEIHEKNPLAAPRDSTSRGRSSLISVMASSNKPLETLASHL